MFFALAYSGNAVTILVTTSIKFVRKKRKPSLFILNNFESLMTEIISYLYKIDNNFGSVVGECSIDVRSVGSITQWEKC